MEFDRAGEPASKGRLVERTVKVSSLQQEDDWK